MLHSTCPSVGLNGTTTDVPRNLEELMKRCALIKPKLDSYYFLQLGDNPFNKLFRGINQDIILTKYAHQSLYQPPPSTQTGFSSQMLRQDGTEEWDGVVPGTQNENPLPSIESPSKNTPVVIEEINRDVKLAEENETTLQHQGDTRGTYLCQPKRTTRYRGKRGLKLIVDSRKVMTNEMIRTQISDYTDITYQKRTFPPNSRRAIQCKAKCADEILLTMPAIAFNQGWFPAPILDIFNSNFRRVTDENGVKRLFN